MDQNPVCLLTGSPRKSKSVNLGLVGADKGTGLNVLWPFRVGDRRLRFPVVRDSDRLAVRRGEGQ